MPALQGMERCCDAEMRCNKTVRVECITAGHSGCFWSFKQCCYLCCHVPQVSVACDESQRVGSTQKALSHVSSVAASIAVSQSVLEASKYTSEWPWESLRHITHLLQGVQQCCCLQSALMLHARSVCVSVSINIQHILSTFGAALRALCRGGIAHCKDAAPIFLRGLHHMVATSPC